MRSADHINLHVISLPGVNERRAAIEEQLKCLRISWRFFDAHSQQSASLKIPENSWCRLNGRNLKQSEIACYSSHYALWEETANLPEGCYNIIFEDDVIIDPIFFNDIDQLDLLASEYKYIRFNAQIPAASSKVRFLERRRVVRFRSKVHGTLAYLITPSAAKKLLRFNTVYRPVDVEIDRFWANGLPIYCVYQFAAIERADHSGIGLRNMETEHSWNRFIWKINIRIESLRCAFANLKLDMKIAFSRK